MTHAVLMTIGDEILSGNTVDTNSSFIAGQLKSIGIKVAQIFTISDDKEAIKNTLKQALELGNIVIMTGGIGPTRDDKTKTALAEFFDDELVLDATTFEHLRNLLEQRNRLHILDLNKGQAEVLSKAKVFQNPNGTAPCQMIEQNGKFIFSLPGVPYEVKPLIKDQILPFLTSQFSLEFIISRIVSVVGIPESVLAQTIEKWEDELPKNIELSYLPIANRIKLRLTGTGNSKENLEKTLQTEIDKVEKIIGENIVGTFEERIEKILGELLIDQKLTISTAESCTGGAVSRILTSVSGSSQYFLGGVVTYATQKKIELLKVKEETISKFTVVSEEVASEMAIGCKELFQTDISISTTGVAGPKKGEDGKEVGTVFYTVRIGNQEKTTKLYLPHMEREDFMNFVAVKAIQEVVEILIKNKS